MLLGGAEGIAIPIVVDQYGSGKVANCLGYYTPFMGTWCAAKSKAEHEEGNSVIG